MPGQGQLRDVGEGIGGHQVLVGPGVAGVLAVEVLGDAPDVVDDDRPGREVRVDLGDCLLHVRLVVHCEMKRKV